MVLNVVSEVDEVLNIFQVKEKKHESFITRAVASLYYQLRILFEYRMAIAIDIIDITISVLIYYFVSFLISKQALSSLGYSPDYLAFAVLGISLSRYLWSSISRLAHKLSHEISEGTLESLVVADVDNLKSWLVGQIMYGFSWSSFWFVGAIIIGMILGAGISTNLLAWFQAIFILLLTIVVHSGIGVIAAGMYIKHKELETMLFFLSVAMEFLGGVLYPISLLYNIAPLYYISLSLPFTHGLELFRRTLMDELPLLHPKMIFHMVFLIAFLPLVYLGFKVFNKYLEIAKKEGILAAY